MAKKKASKPRGTRAVGAAAPKALPTPTPLPAPAPACSKTLTFFQNVTVGPGQNHDSTTAQNVDCFQWLHVWVLAKHKASMAMDNISVELVYELTGKMGATGFANLELPYAVNVRPTPLRANSGQPAGGYGGFVIRAPIIGPAVRVIVINSGAQTYDFSLWGYATH